MLFVYILSYTLCSCNFQKHSVPKENMPNTLLNKYTRSVSKGEDSSTQILQLIAERKEIPISQLNRYFSFDSLYLKRAPYVTGFGVYKINDSVSVAYIDCFGGHCGDRFIITVNTRTLNEISKMQIASFCDADYIMKDTLIADFYETDSTFETKTSYHLRAGREIDTVVNRLWKIDQRGIISLAKRNR